MILIVDFGSQTAHLIGRRLIDMGIETHITTPEEATDDFAKFKPRGVILSGGPSSVYDTGAPTLPKAFFSYGVPMLGICYGWQLMAHLLGGSVKPSRKEYGPAQLDIQAKSPLFEGVFSPTTVWMSHGDSVMKAPHGFEVVGSTPQVRFGAVVNPKKKMYGIQFHPEATHTIGGIMLLSNFATLICNLPLKPKSIDVDSLIGNIRETVGKKLVIGAFSGGTDSVVAGALVARAIGKQFKPFFVDNGLMRDATLPRMKKIFPKVLGMPVEIISAEGDFLRVLKGVTDPEVKRKAIGKQYIESFEKQLKKYPNAAFLMQGTTYADFIHSQGTKHSAHIKSHHNVGGLPEHMKLSLVEPLKYFYTDQVREIGMKLGLPKDVVYQQPFPGPGHAVRILGEVTKERLTKQKLADSILLEEMKKAGWYEKVFQCWTILTGTNSTAVKGDGRFYGEVVALRIVNTIDRMSVDWVYLPHELLQRISSRIVNEVPQVSRVVLDITTKPPATMEWE